MKTAIVGGGRGCRAILEMVFSGRLHSFPLEILCVVDPVENAPGMVYAKEHGIVTLPYLDEALALPGLEVVIELVGSDHFLKDLYKEIPPGIRVIDHHTARLFWELEVVTDQLEEELGKKEELEAKLLRERNLLQQILDSLPDAVIVLNSQKRLEWVNARLEEFTGIHPMDLTTDGKYTDPFCEHLSNQEDPGYICSLEEVISTKKPVQFIYFDPNLDADRHYYRIIVTPILNHNGQIEHIVETARPIDRQVTQNREITESEQRFRLFVENAHDMITMKDLEGCYQIINDRAASLFGMSPMDFIGRSDREIFPPKLADTFLKKDQMTISEKKFSRDKETLYVQGERRHLDTARFPLLNYRGDITGVCSISRDVTEQEKLQNAYIQSEKMAAIGRLAASVAHEINNPLTGVLTFAEEMMLDVRKKDPQGPLVEDLDVIVREAMRCRHIVAQLLDYARVGKPHQHLMCLNKIIERTLALVKEQAAFQDVTFELDLAESLPEAVIDPTQIQQVFLNLIINAADAMDNSGKIQIRTDLSPDGRNLEASVADEGPGIPQEMIKNIFNPFFSTKGARGTGLGLSCVQNIVEQHNGIIEVQSPHRQGAVFKVILPLPPKGPAQRCA